jgi:hypothetical protein
VLPAQVHVRGASVGAFVVVRVIPAAAAFVDPLRAVPPQVVRSQCSDTGPGFDGLAVGAVPRRRAA